MRVLGVDTSLRSTGIAVVEPRGSRLRSVEHGRIKNPSAWPHSQCLLAIHEQLSALIERTHPDCAAIEGAFFSRNANTAMVLGQARGVVISVCALAGLSVYEYAPRRVKQAVVGSGGAPKDQVARMVASLLGLEKPPQHDAADALALAICHLNSRTSVKGLEPEPI